MAAMPSRAAPVTEPPKNWASFADERHSALARFRLVAENDLLRRLPEPSLYSGARLASSKLPAEKSTPVGANNSRLLTADGSALDSNPT